MEEEEKSTFRAFTLRADKPFKKSIRLANLLKIEKNHWKQFKIVENKKIEKIDKIWEEVGRKKSTFRAFASRAKKPKKVERNVARLKDALWVEPS